MASKKAFDIVLRHQVAIERLKAGYSKNYGKTLRQLDKEIREILGSIKVKTMGELTKKQSLIVIKRLRDRQASVYSIYSKELFKSLEELAVSEADFEASALEKLFEGSIAIKIPSALVVVDRVFDRPLLGGELLKPFVENWAEKEIAAVEKATRRAYAEGWPLQRLVEVIGGTKQARYKDGILGRNDNGAAMVARTAIQHVSQSARITMWEANKSLLDGYKWLSTLDSRTTQACRSLDGEFFEFGKGPLPPIHPGCRSTTLPELNSKFDFDDGKGTRSSQFGSVPEKLTYYDWLKTQDSKFQDFAIGPTRGKLLRDGGLTSDEFARLNLGRNFEPLTHEEMKKKAPQAFELAGLK